MISLKLYSSLSIEEIKNFYDFLTTTQSEGLPAGINMWDNDWESKNETLPFILEKTDRFNSANGEYHIIYDGSTIIACGGVYISNFSNRIAIGGVRTWVDKEYRNNSILREYLLPAHKLWCQERNIDILALTFNEYNKNLPHVFKRRRLGESIERITTREPKHMFYNGLCEVKFPVTIQYTKQWLIYEKLEEGFDFNWKDIEWKN
jgi:hypothetical protein